MTCAASERSLGWFLFLFGYQVVKDALFRNRVNGNVSADQNLAEQPVLRGRKGLSLARRKVGQERVYPALDKFGHRVQGKKRAAAYPDTSSAYEVGGPETTQGGSLVDLFARACAIKEKVRSWRRRMHENPELGLETENTAAFIEKTLAEIGVKNARRCGKTGVVALVEGSAPGDCIGLRADIDALPVHERNDLPYRSRVQGAMHACGHDVHAACLLGAAQLLYELRDSFKGSVKLIFQPGEEGFRGAAVMIEDGALEKPAMKSIYSVHTWPELPAGTVGLRKGPVMASAQPFRITVKGKQGHAAHPHRCVDAVLITGQIICALQSVMAREVAPLETGVLSIGSVHGGTKNNILPEEVRLEGTIRAFSTQVNQQIIDAARRIAEGTAATLRGSAVFETLPGLLPVFNEDDVYAKMREAFEQTLGPERLVDLPLPSMGSEDFSLFLEQVPGGHFRVGVGGKEGPNHPLHSPDFTVDEACLPYGAAGLAALALKELGALK